MAQQPDEFLLDQLVLMGFDTTQASNALVRTNNKSIDAAIEVLYNTPAPPVVVPKAAPHIPKARPAVHNTPNQAKRGKVDKSARYDSDNSGNSDSEYDSDGEAFIDEDEEMYDADPRTEMATVLDTAQLQATATAEIERISSITETSLATAGALLRAFKWNSEKLLESYYDNPEKVLKMAGVADSSTQQSTPVVEYADCEICGDSLKNNPSSRLDCNHVFCNDCLAQYLTVQINDGKSLDIGCMAFKCKATIGDDLIKTLVSSAIYSKYRAFVLKSFVEDNPNVKWCPRPGCGNAVKSDTKNLSDAQCSCGFKFCFKCNEEAHAPSLCVMMKLWIKKCKDDSETCNWLSVNTQDCPQCNSAIEKNGGCNHMTCRKCHHEFCWICGGKWAGHATCNKYVEKEGQQKNMDRAALERYLHYFHRYNVHEQSKKFETALRNAAVAKMETIQNSEESRWIDVQYIDSATEQLIECRRTLKYTYVFAFYLIDGVEKNLFEYLQSELETTTEQLSGALEAPVGTKEPRQIKDLSLLAAKRLQHLVAGVEEMLESKHRPPLATEVISLLNKGDASSPAAPPVSVQVETKHTSSKTTPAKKSSKKK